MKTSLEPSRKQRARFARARGARAARPPSPLISSEERFRKTLDGMIEGCMLIGFDWSYLYVNEAAARYSHQAREHFVGRTMIEVHPGLKQSGIYAACKKVMRDRAPRHLESEYLFPDGSTGWYQLSVEPAPEGIFVLSMDITKRKQAETALARSNHALRTLSACDEKLVRANGEPELLAAVCRILVEQRGYRMAWVAFAAPDTGGALRAAAQFGFEAGGAAAAGFARAAARRGFDPTLTAVRSGAVQSMQDILTDPALIAWRRTARRHGFQSIIALPLKSAMGTFGALTIGSADPEAFNGEEVQLLQELADNLAFGIESLRTRAERDRMIEEQGHHAQMLRHGLEESIKIIAGTVEMRDPYTAGHQLRVSELAVAIGREMSLPEDQVEGIRLAAIIHDLGKITLPGEILSKPGRLSPIELQLIQTHAQAGRDLLKDVQFPWPIADIIWQHHEHLDGSGYPRGLEGPHILLEARILTVADVVEAVASHRPYRAALGIGAALQNIRRGRGKLYDPAVVGACLRVFRKGGFAFGSRAA